MTKFRFFTSVFGLLSILIFSLLLVACSTNDLPATATAQPAIEATTTPANTTTAPAKSTDIAITTEAPVKTTIASTTTTIPAATSTITPQATPTTALQTTPANPVSTIGCFRNIDYGNYPLSNQIKDSTQIFVGQVTKIGGWVWNTPDGTPPPTGKECQYEQFAPVEITVKQSFKGNPAGTKITVWLWGGPGAKPFGNDAYFPKLNEQDLWFLGHEYDFRQGQGNSPLTTLTLVQLYTAQANDSWSSVTLHQTITISQLKEAI